MTSFPLNTEEHWEHVQTYLVRAMPDCKLTSEPLVSGQRPVILMWTAQLMAAFALSNGDAGASYRKLFGSFKEYYAANRTRLDDRDLSFVFCVRPDLPNLDEFCSEVETDVYFCRKFVVPLAQSLDKSFERLPFLPLTLGTGRLQRPPSARTYMQQECGVPATLAKYLAVPHQRGAQNIVKDCLNESSEWMPILAGRSRPKIPMGEGGRDEESVRLNAVSIRNFRAYKKTRVFDLSGAVTVLYGPNGFGKTSFFDAIDFAATGGVGRLGLSASTDRFAKAVAHLDSRPQDAFVTLDFGAKGVGRRISRCVATRMHASLDNSTCDRKKALVEMTGGGLKLADRIEHLVSLFRATHLFSQEHQELAKGFDRDCALPPQVVSHILAFDDYATARSKAAEVCEVLDQASSQERENIGVVRRQIEEAELTVGSLEQVGGQYPHTAGPVEALASLRRRAREAGLAVPVEETDRVFVRACRAAIQVQLTEREARIRRLAALVEEVRTLPGVVAGLAQLGERRDRAESELRSAEEAFGEAEAAQREADSVVQELEDRTSEGRVTAEALKWVRETLPRYRELLGREGATVQGVEDASNALVRLRERRAAAVLELRNKEEAAAGAALRLVGGRRLVAELKKLAGAVETWRSDVVAVAQLEVGEATVGGELEDLRRQEKALSSTLGQNREAQGRMKQDIEGLEREQSDFARLLARVEDHIRDALCPLCGHDHGSVDALRKQVEMRRTVDVAAALRSKIGLLRDAGEELERRLADVQRNAARNSEAVEESREERKARETRVVGFEEDVAKVGLTLKEPTVTMAEIDALGAEVRASVEKLERTDLASRAAVESMQTMMAELDRGIAAGEKTVVETKRELEDWRREIARLRGDDRAVQVSLDARAETVAEVGDLQIEELRRMETAVSKAVDTAKERRGAVNRLRQRVSVLATTVDALKKEVAARRRTVTETNGRLAEYGLLADVEDKEVVRLLEDETRANDHLAELRDFADSVEIAMDTATTAAALRQQREAIRKWQRRIEESEGDIEQYERWRDYFAELGDRIASKQNAAIAGFAEEYGPTASAIQQRLRSVYGFHGIDTRSHESTIRVRVKRGKEILRPTDYFSDSQQRTLLLGLFLTACISQTWSSLSTVLLDDPIMHFDDLNTYAFLDMVAGLLSTRSGPRQFIISTCDKRVLHLARSRFRHLSGEARFYSFSAIGPDGPLVEEITPV